MLKIIVACTLVRRTNGSYRRSPNPFLFQCLHLETMSSSVLLSGLVVLIPLYSELSIMQIKSRTTTSTPPASVFPTPSKSPFKGNSLSGSLISFRFIVVGRAIFPVNVLPFTPNTPIFAGLDPTVQFSLFSSLIFAFRTFFCVARVVVADVFVEDGRVFSDCVGFAFRFGEALGLRMFEVSIEGRTCRGLRRGDS